MNPNRFDRRRTLATLASGAVALVLFAGPPGTAAARAQASAAAPEFSAPLDISNPLLPFVPGAVKVFAGRADGRAVTVVETHRSASRTFDWNGTAVDCRVVEELEFKGGVLVARTQRFFAQANDGSVWTFGEVEDADPSDDPPGEVKEPSSWIVGQRGAGDPQDTVTATQPAMAMPAGPPAGAQWTSVDVPGFVKSSRVQDADAAVRVTGGRHTGCLRVRESDHVDGTARIDWYAPGLGRVEVRAPAERLVLTASTVRRGR